MYRLIDIVGKKSGCSSCERSKRLLEAYSEKAIQGFLDRFREEADDLNLAVTDSQIRTYIKTFDRTKEKLPTDRRDLNQWKIGELIRFATSGKGGEADENEEIDITPDVVYHNDDNSIAIYNGSTEGNCIKYGKGESWCITRTSFPNYRFNRDRGYPTFYLARNINLPENDKLSFVAIQVLNPDQTSESERYVYTNRKNSPYQSERMSFSELESEVPWLKQIPNLQSILKYIPLSSAEKVSHQFKRSPVSYKEWSKFPFSLKKQYLVVRKEDNEMFTDISNSEFVNKFLPKYPDILKFVAETPGVIEPKALLKNLGNLPDSARKSVTANLSPIPVSELTSSALPFEVKKVLVKLKKWKLDPSERLYVTKDGNTIVKLTLDDELEMGLYQADDDYPSVKLNKRTGKFLQDYPELDQLPLSLLIDLAEKNAIGYEPAMKIIDDAKQDPNSPVVVGKTEDGEIVIDPSLLKAYKVKDGKITNASFSDEEVQNVFRNAQENEQFKKQILTLFTGEPRNIPDSVDPKALANIIKSLPYNQRIVTLPTGRGAADNPQDSIALVDPETSDIFFMPAEPENDAGSIFRSSRAYNGRRISSVFLDKSMFKAYFDYLRTKNKVFTDEEIIGLLRSGYGSVASRFVAADPPLSPNNILVPVQDEDGTTYLLNTRNRRNSQKISSSGRLVGAILSQGRYDQLLRRARPDIQQQAEPAQQAAEPAQQAAVQQRAGTGWRQPAPTGEVNIAQMMGNLGAAQQMNQLPSADRRRLNITNGAELNRRTDGGARRRNQLLGNAGEVTHAYAALTSRIYVIRLANGTNVVSIKVYPGNREYLVIPGQAALQLNEPSDLLRALRQRNLAEAKKYLIKSYLDTNPTNLEEFKQILRKHINKEQ